MFTWGFPGGSVVKGSAWQCRRTRRCGFDPWVRKIPWKRNWQPTPAFLPGKSHGQRNLAGYGAWGLHGVSRSWTQLSNWSCSDCLDAHILSPLPPFFPTTTVFPLVPHLFPLEWKLPQIRNYMFAVCSVGFPGGSVIKESACIVGDLGSVPGSGRSPGEGNGYPIQYSCLENS